jgi:hypothetical protein
MVIWDLLYVLEVMTSTSDPTSNPYVTSVVQGVTHAKFGEAGSNSLAATLRKHTHNLTNI